MTFSIVARSIHGTDEGVAEYGVAVASKFLAVGAIVPAALADVGAIATQSLANLRYRADGLALLYAGRSAQETLDRLTADDDQRGERQAGVVDARGGSASYTGSECLPWAGGRSGLGYAIQGNILTGANVVEDMERAWLDSDPAWPLSRRMLVALIAGDHAGGDSRGRQSAAILVVTPGGGYGGGSDVAVDLRVDDHPNPVAELVRLLDIRDLLFGRTDPDECVPLINDTLDDVRVLLESLGFDDPHTEHALSSFAGIENLEERLVPGRIDPLVYKHLAELAARAQPS